MNNKMTNFPEVGWVEERFQVQVLNDDVCEFEWTMQSGGSVPVHLHKDSDEYFKVLEGEVTFKVNGKTIIGKPGFEITIPKMALHSVSNKSSERIKCKVVYSPVADQGKFFQILFFLSEKNPNYKNAMFKAMYISNQMKFREFSTLQGGTKIFMNFIFAFFKVFAPIMGWNKLLEEYQLKIIH
ncbi:MAG: cupin domain-containing protein [Saprospiraceae bacterium]|nr:cupin domain-containing protein [Saprospiraceae bacterium]